MRSIATIVFWLATLCVLPAYDFIGRRLIRWPDGSVPMNLQLDLTMDPQPLSDGKSSWDAVAEEALGIWNAQLARVHFTTFTDPGRGDGDDENQVFFSSEVYGQRFGRFVLAITTTWRIGTQRVEADVIFNDQIEWDSYRGNLGFSPLDLRRVAIHEFGHALGLDHPDEAKQVEVAVMNSSVSDLDTLARDDIHGARALYPPDTTYALNVAADGTGEVIAFPPSDAEGRYPAGTIVKLMARPDRRNRFATWSGDENRTGRMLKVRVVDETTIVANFSTNGAPVVTSHPASRTSGFGDSATFQVRAASATPLQYQWQFEGADIPDATFPELFLNFVTHDNSGLYACRITNTRGETVSRAARLVVDGY